VTVPRVPSYWREDTPDLTVEQHREHSDQINALRTRIGSGDGAGYLSNQVWNMRNRYLANPNGTFTAVEVRVLVEGFLAEIATPGNADCAGDDSCTVPSHWRAESRSGPHRDASEDAEPHPDCPRWWLVHPAHRISAGLDDTGVAVAECAGRPDNDDVQPVGDHPHLDPGDGRVECQVCGKWVHLVIHSCKGVPVTAAAKARRP
jgi:hypothetical protein